MVDILWGVSRLHGGKINSYEIWFVIGYMLVNSFIEYLVTSKSLYDLCKYEGRRNELFSFVPVFRLKILSEIKERDNGNKKGNWWLVICKISYIACMLIGWIVAFYAYLNSLENYGWAIQWFGLARLSSFIFVILYILNIYERFEKDRNTGLLVVSVLLGFGGYYIYSRVNRLIGKYPLKLSTGVLIIIRVVLDIVIIVYSLRVFYYVISQMSYRM